MSREAYEVLNKAACGHDLVVSVRLSTLVNLLDQPLMFDAEAKRQLIDDVKRQIDGQSLAGGS